MIELLVTAAVLVIAFGALSVTLANTMSLRAQTHETTLAVQAAQSALARVRGEPFERAFASFNADPDDDPDGPGTAPGAGFAVEGLRPRGEDADGLVGRIEFPGDGTELREDVPDESFGTPRDLNADGLVDGEDRAADYTLLPVRVVVEWTGHSGPNAIELVSSVTEF